MTTPQDKQSARIDKPAPGTKYLHASLHRDAPHAVASVLADLAQQVAAVAPIQVSLGYLNPRISDDDNRSQVTIEFYDYLKQDLDARSQLVSTLPPPADPSHGVIRRESVERLLVRLPKGKGQDDVVLLLQTASKELLELGDVNVLDLLIATPLGSDGVEYPQVTIYYSRVIAQSNL